MNTEARFHTIEANSINDFADIIFIKNTKDIPIQIECPDFENTKDLYMFCVELTFKGIQVLYGSDSSNNVDITALTETEIEFVRKKLLNAGIETNLTFNQIDPSDNLYKDDDLVHITNMMPTPLKLNPDTDKYEPVPSTPETDKIMAQVPLENYILIITKRYRVYKIRFNLKVLNASDYKTTYF